MSLFGIVLLVIQLVAALGIVVLVLLQHGKGADMGAAFGSGASGSLFGATGSANFLSRATGVLATVFFVCTLGLAAVAGGKPSSTGGIMGDIPGALPAATTPKPEGAAPADAGSTAPASAPASSTTPAPAAPAAAPNGGAQSSDIPK